LKTILDKVIVTTKRKLYMMYETMRFLTALSDNVMSALENFSVVNISKKSRRKKVQLLSLSYLITKW